MEGGDDHDLAAAWSALRDQAEGLFDPEGAAVDVIGALASARPACEPSREDIGVAAAALCQTIHAAIAVTQGLAVHLCGPDPAKEGIHARPH